MKLPAKYQFFITKTHTTPPPIPLYIPNILCYIRIILAFLSIYTSLKSADKSPDAHAFFHVSMTAVLWIISCLLDHLDGKLARKFNQCSDLGVILDIIADNILRSCSWISCLVLLLLRHREEDDNCINGGILGLTMVVVGLSSMEWLTMLSTQMLAVLKQKSHWKLIPSDDPGGGHDEDGLMRKNDDGGGPKESYPWWVERIFEKSFYNPVGVITIYGSMSAGMMHFLHLQREVLLKPFPSLGIVFDIARMVAYLGRIIALACEIYFCWDFFNFIVKRDERKKVRMII